MTKKSPDKQHLRPMPWRDFVLGFEAATRMLAVARAARAPVLYLNDPTAVARRAARQGAANDPYNQVSYAAREQLGEGHEYLGCFNYRFWALIGLYQRGHLSQWVTPREGESEATVFHPAVLLAAAEVKLTKNGRFPIRQFIERVEEIIHTEGS